MPIGDMTQQLLAIFLFTVIVHYNTMYVFHLMTRSVDVFIPIFAGAHPMSAWHDNSPIYRQLKDKLVGMMLDGDIKPGDALPSVRQIAAEYQLNPITVSRAFQELADENVVEKRRGLGMYMSENAKDQLLSSEKQRFLQDEWPLIVARIRRLGLQPEHLFASNKGEQA